MPSGANVWAPLKAFKQLIQIEKGFSKDQSPVGWTSRSAIGWTKCDQNHEIIVGNSVTPNVVAKVKLLINKLA